MVDHSSPQNITTLHFYTLYKSKLSTNLMYQTIYLLRLSTEGMCPCFNDCILCLFDRVPQRSPPDCLLWKVVTLSFQFTEKSL